jgi:hypothetical protein
MAEHSADVLQLVIDFLHQKQLNHAALALEQEISAFSQSNLPNSFIFQNAAQRRLVDPSQDLWFFSLLQFPFSPLPLI